MLRTCSSLALAMVIGGWLGAKTCSAEAPNPSNDLLTLRSNPDQFAWMLFVHVNSRVSPKSQDALWETWADDPLTFPANPDPANPPKWPDPTHSHGGTAEFRKSLRLRSKVEGHTLRMNRSFEKALKAKTGAPLPQEIDPSSQAGFAPVVEQVTRNKVTFDYIIRNSLWYQQGNAERVNREPAIIFPTDSIAIKAEWKPLTASDDKTKYHWNTDDKGNVYGLVALHITSKAIPNWVWTTFEWVDNPGRSDYIGSSDTFGVNYPIPPKQQVSQGSRPSTRTFQAPNPQLGTVYPAGEFTKVLDELFDKSFGADNAWKSQFKNYRLKGTQVDFVDATGRPTLLGNSIAENGFVATSSCITCHARASVAGSGSGAGSAPFSSFAPSINNAGNISYNGSPNPGWFFTGVPGIAGGLKQSAPQVNFQTDFLWGIPFANPAK